MQVCRRKDSAPGHALLLYHLLAAMGTGYRGNIVSGQSMQECVFLKFVSFLSFCLYDEALAIRESETCTRVGFVLKIKFHHELPYNF